MERIKVVIVDDSFDTRNSIRQLLSFQQENQGGRSSKDGRERLPSSEN